MNFANVPVSLKVQLSSQSCGLVGNVCDTCFGLVCFTFIYVSAHESFHQCLVSAVGSASVSYSKVVI